MTRQAKPQVAEVVLPCLDEAAALPWVLSRLPAGYRAIVADNGSSDGSPRIAAEHGAIVVHVPQRGFGAAVAAGLAAATASIVCVCDADASFDLAQLPRVVEPVASGRSDLVLGSRRSVRRGVWPVHARLANRVLVRLLHRALGAGAPELTDIGPMRAMRRDGVAALELKDRRFGYPLEMVLEAVRAGYTVSEVPVDYLPRAGRSKITGTVRGTFRTVRDMRAVLAR